MNAWGGLMQKSSIKQLNTEPIRSFLFITSLVLLKLILQLVLFSQDFVSVSADEFSRGIRAAKWALKPQLNLLSDMKGTWLPFEKYLNGFLLMVWPDVFWAPRVTVFIASCFVMIALYVLVYYLFEDFVTASLDSILLVFQPWYIWLSATPMLEMYYLAFFLGGVVFFIAWLKDSSRGFWFWAGLCFMLASGFHWQSWVYVNLVFLITVNYFFQYASHQQFGRLARLIGVYLLSNSIIIISVILEYLITGQIFSFLSHHTHYSKWFYKGYEVSILEKLLYYPKLIVDNSSTAIWVFVLAGIAFLVIEKASRWKFFPLTFAVLGLSFNSVMNVISVPATAAPARYSLFYLMMLSPYAAYGTYRLSTIGRQWSPRLLSYTSAFLSIGLFSYSIWWGMVRIAEFPLVVSKDAVTTGYLLNQKLNQNEGVQLTRYLVELEYWDFLGVQLTAGHYDAVYYDREYDLFNRDAPSIFMEKPIVVCDKLASQNIRYVALYDSQLKENAQTFYCLDIEMQFGSWTVFGFVSQP
jgi:hypothetical protein